MSVEAGSPGDRLSREPVQHNHWFRSIELSGWKQAGGDSATKPASSTTPFGLAMRLSSAASESITLALMLTSSTSAHSEAMASADPTNTGERKPAAALATASGSMSHPK